MRDALNGLIDVDGHAPIWSGPTSWWNGPLDVEGLARDAVTLAGAAANAISPGTVEIVRAEDVAANFASISQLRIDRRGVVAFAPMSGYFRCSDGWLRTHANYSHHADALRRALGADDRDGLERALADRPATDAERTIRAHGGVAAAVRTGAEWAASDPGRAIAGEPWIRWRAGESERSLRLKDLRVLDISRVIAGPTATKFLASLGADVLRIDPPGMPELLDAYLDTGAGKRSALADLNDPGTRGRVHALIATADVVLLGYRPGGLERFGLDPEDLSVAHPHLAVIHLDAWGDRGPWSGERGFDSVVQAPTGIAEIYRGGDGAPGALPVQALDHATGYGAAAAALALCRRGGVAHLSLAATAAHLMRRPRSVPASPAPPLELEVRLAEVDSPHGRLEQVRPLVGAPRAPGAYGSSRLEWTSAV